MTPKQILNMVLLMPVASMGAFFIQWGLGTLELWWLLLTAFLVVIYLGVRKDMIKDGMLKAS